MEWFKVFTNVRDSPKLLSVSYEARWEWLRCLSHVCHHETDGVVMCELPREPIVKELVEAGLWDSDTSGNANGNATGNAYGTLRFHAFERYQRSHADMEETRALEQEQKRRRSVAGHKGAEVRWGGGKRGDGNATGNAMAPANATAPSDGNGKEKRREEHISLEQWLEQKKWHPESLPIAEYLRDLLAAEGARIPASLKDWVTVAHYLLDIDKREPDHIRAVIVWARQDEFWSGNIFSMGAVRKQWDKLDRQRQRPRKDEPPELHYPDLRDIAKGDG